MTEDEKRASDGGAPQPRGLYRPQVIAQTVLLITYVVCVLVFPDAIAQRMCVILPDGLDGICRNEQPFFVQRLSNVMYSLTLGGAVWGFINYAVIEALESRMLRLLVPVVFLFAATLAGVPTELSGAVLLLTLQLALFLAADIAVLRSHMGRWAVQGSDYDYEHIKRALRTVIVSTGPALMAGIAILALADKLFGDLHLAGVDECAASVERSLHAQLPRLALTGSETNGIAAALRGHCRGTATLLGSSYLVGSLTALLVVANASFVAIWWLPRASTRTLRKRPWILRSAFIVSVTLVLIGVIVIFASP